MIELSFIYPLTKKDILILAAVHSPLLFIGSTSILNNRCEHNMKEI